jgi:thioredoxin-related protein
MQFKREWSMRAQFLLLLLWFLPVLLSANENHDLPIYSRIYAPDRNPFDDARAALQLARQTQRQVFIAVGGNWCIWCKKFDQLLNDNAELKTAFYQRFIVLKINVSDQNSNEEFIRGLPAFSGYPHFFVAAANGSIVLSQSPTEFVVNGEFMAAKVLAFVRASKPAPVLQRSDTLGKAPAGTVVHDQ